MATIYKTPKKRRDPKTGKLVDVIGPDGKPVTHPKWRTVIFDHTGKRKAFTLTTHKATSQKQADLIELREREIKNGIRPKPETAVEAEAKPKKVSRPFGEVFVEYMAWGRAQGGRRGLPWSDIHAYKKERDITMWRESLGLEGEDIAAAADILTKVEAGCRKMLADGKSGKTVSNRVQNLRAMLLWCRKRKYLNENPLAELGKFNTEPTFVRRAMALGEYNALMIGCADHRRLLYEVASCSGFRRNELRKLEPKHLDHKRCGIRVSYKMDKARKERLQPIPAALMERLVAFVDSGEAKRLYKRFYRNQGDRPERREPPKNPLLYVPSNPATALKKDLEAAGIPYETEEGRLDFHALRTAYINFLMDVGASPKTMQSLARHATLEMTMNVYGRERQDRNREAVEALGEMLTVAERSNVGLTASNIGQQNYQISTIRIDIEELLKDITIDEIEGYLKKDWCRKQDVAGTFHGLRGVPNRRTA
jgi:integrase